MGHIHGRHARLGQSLGLNCDVVSVADENAASAKELAATLNVAHYTNDIASVLSDPNIDAISLSIPVRTTYPTLAESIKAGKHVFSEKPGAYSSEEIKHLIDLLGDASDDQKVAISYQKRCFAPIQRVKNSIDSGEIGSANLVRTVARDMDASEEQFIALSGTAFRDFFVHDFDLVRYLTESRIAEVYSNGDVFVHDVYRKYNDVDYAQVSLKTESGVIGLCTMSRHCTYGYDQEIEVFGTQGKATFGNRWENSAVFAGAAGFTRSQIMNHFSDLYPDAYLNSLAAFV